MQFRSNSPLVLRLPLSLAFFLILCGNPELVSANVGPPSKGGHITGEPIGIKNIAISRETLTIDLRPLAQNELARVEAIYHLNNQGEEQLLDLVFAVGSKGTKDFEVWLDDEVIQTQRSTDLDIPDSWKAPKDTPGIGNDGPLDYLRYNDDELAPIAFQLTIPPGAKELKVRYAAAAATHFYGRPTVFRQFAYVLAPARSWAGFGGMDLKIHLPDNWNVACNLSMDRLENTLSSSFDNLPADSISLTVQAPMGWSYLPFVYGTQILFGLVALGGAIFCWFTGRSSGRLSAQTSNENGDSQHGRVWLWSICACSLWGLALFGAGTFAVFGPDSVLPANQITRYGYDQVFASIGVLLVSIAVVPVGFVITLVSSRFYRVR